MLCLIASLQVFSAAPCLVPWLVLCAPMGRGPVWEQSELGEVLPSLYCGDLVLLGFPASLATSPVL